MSGGFFVIIVITVVITLPLMLLIGIVGAAIHANKSHKEKSRSKCICCQHMFLKSKYDGICDSCGDNIVRNARRL